MQSGTTFSEHLTSLRKGRKVSLGVLAQQAGINKSTLSRWESGTSVPRVPEMMRVLDVLDASTAAQAVALRLLDVPRAIVAERTANLAPMRLSLGDLLFGLRQRAGLTQAEAGRGAGVTQGLYSRWEGDGAQPDAGQIHAVCFALGATGEEAATLTSRAFAHAPVEQDRDALMVQYMKTLPWEEGATAASHNLLFLSYLANFGRLYRMGKADIGDIALMVANFGDNALSWGNDKEKSTVYYQRACTLAAQTHEPLHFHLAPAMAGAETDAPTSASSANEVKAYISAALSWLPRFQDKVAHAFLLSKLARRIASCAPDDAVRLSETYCLLVIDNPREHSCRLSDRGNLLRLCGRFTEAIEVFATLEPLDDYRDALRNLYLAESLVDVEARGEAAHCLGTAKKMIADLGITCIPNEVATVERLFN